MADRRPPVESPETRSVRVTARDRDTREVRDDAIAVEEPLEIRIQVPESGARHAIAVTMRTPGHDRELAVGFLLSEGLLRGPDDVTAVAHCGGVRGEPQENVINVTLAPGVPFDAARFTRNVYTTSSCGICGKASIEMVRAVCPPRPETGLRFPAAALHALPKRLAEAQPVFARTGGLHASALFNAKGDVELVREDVGRHNALDKVLGALLLDRRLPASGSVLLVSGRASYELVQKALMAGIPILAAVGAPSSLAVETARELGMTLVGFLRDGRFNVYCGDERIS